jgi:transcriptional regulator with XRE-family HTH domain
MVNNNVCGDVTTKVVYHTAMSTLASRLSQAMEAAGLNQASLAKAASAKGRPVTQQNVQQLLSGRNKTSKHLPALARALDVNLEWLMEGAESASPPMEDDDTGQIARRLQLSREAMGMKPADLCRRTGIRLTTYSKWENAEAKPSLNEAMILRRHFAYTLDWIYDGDPSGLPHALATRIAELEQTPPHISGPARKPNKLNRN